MGQRVVNRPQLPRGRHHCPKPLKSRLAVTPDVASDIDIVLEVNMHESFRWQDQEELGFAAGVFDTVPTAFEPVMRFGANEFALSLEIPAS